MTWTPAVQPDDACKVAEVALRAAGKRGLPKRLVIKIVKHMMGCSDAYAYQAVYSYFFRRPGRPGFSVSNPGRPLDRQIMYYHESRSAQAS